MLLIFIILTKPYNALFVLTQLITNMIFTFSHHLCTTLFHSTCYILTPSARVLVLVKRQSFHHKGKGPDPIVPEGYAICYLDFLNTTGFG